MTAVFVRGFDFGTTEQDVKKYFKQAGAVTSVELFGKGNALVTFANAANAQAAVDSFHETTLPGNSRYVEVKINDASKGQGGGKKRSFAGADGPSCRVFVRGFDFGTTDEQFEGHMSQAGSIEQVQWCTKGSAIVRFSSPAEAAAAVSSLQGTTIEGNSRFIDVILKEAEDQGPPSKRAKGGMKGGGGSMKGLGDMGMWVWHPMVPAMGKGLGLGVSKGKGGKGKGRSADPSGSGRVFVRGFDFGTTDEQLLSHMKRAGAIADVHWATKGSAVVIYNKAASAQKAANILNQTTIAGNSRFIDVLLKDSE